MSSQNNHKLGPLADNFGRRFEKQLENHDGAAAQSHLEVGCADREVAGLSGSHFARAVYLMSTIPRHGPLVGAAGGESVVPPWQGIAVKPSPKYGISRFKFIFV